MSQCNEIINKMMIRQQNEQEAILLNEVPKPSANRSLLDIMDSPSLLLPEVSSSHANETCFPLNFAA
jgi:hypothetical protein